MDKVTAFFKAFVEKQGLYSVLAVVIIVAGVYLYFRSKGKKISLSTKDVVAIGIGAALYGVISVFSIPIGPNTGLRIAIALLVIFGAMYGPIVGFLVGFIGHALNDAMMYGSVWWSWVFMSAIIGLFSGFIFLSKDYNIKSGEISKKNIIKMYIYAVLGMLFGSLFAYLGDVFLYGEAPEKIWVQIILANISNFAVAGIVGIPAVIALIKTNKKGTLEKE